MNCASIKSAKFKIDSSESKSPIRRKSFILPAQIEVGLAAEHCNAAAASAVAAAAMTAVAAPIAMNADPYDVIAHFLPN